MASKKKCCSSLWLIESNELVKSGKSGDQLALRVQIYFDERTMFVQAKDVARIDVLIQSRAYQYRKTMPYRNSGSRSNACCFVGRINWCVEYFVFDPKFTRTKAKDVGYQPRSSTKSPVLGYG